MIISNRARIEAVFADLEKRGIIARADFWCCNSCASSAMLNRELPSYQARVGPEHQPIGYVFFHEQSTDSANQGHSLHLLHGSISEADDAADTEQVERDQALVAQIVVEEFREHGFEIDWNGDLGRTIEVVEPHGGWELDYDREEDDDQDEDDECADCGGPLAWDGVCLDDCQDRDED